MLGRGNSFPLRIKTLPPIDGHHFLDMDSLPLKLCADLDLMRPDQDVDAREGGPARLPSSYSEQ